MVTIENGSVKNVDQNRHNELPEVYRRFDEFFCNSSDIILRMNLKHEDKNTIVELLEGLVDHIEILIKDRVKECQGNNDAVIETISRNMEHVKAKFDSIKTRHKRHKIISRDDCYVASEEKAIGLKWKIKNNPALVMPIYNMAQRTYSFVSPLAVLKAVFSMEEFRDVYFQYNRDHVCVPGVYERFCCAAIYKQTNLYQENRNAIQLQLLTDDFEVCAPLKSKVGIYKLCGIYIQIMNLPAHMRSLLRYIFLTILCYCEYVKDAGGFNILLEPIVPELLKLEKEGIEIDPNITLKGGLTNLAGDNLGVNTAFSMSGSFSATNFCRSCEMTKDDCSRAVREKSNLLRTSQSYENCLDQINSAGQPNLKSFLGIKNKCLLNQLSTFKVVENWSLDLMHDGNEGWIPFLLQDLFKYWVENRILSLDKIQSIVRDFKYGATQSRNKPSLINIDKKNLGQNASQLYTIMIHLPFIFHSVKDKIIGQWVLCDQLLKIMQIIYSPKITEENICRLEDLIASHLSDYQTMLGKSLKPKHHNLTHYPTYIRRMGPPINHWMMRGEAKNKQFTDLAKATNNFQNLSKTLATKHQELQISSNFLFKFTLEPSKTCSEINVALSPFQQLLFDYFGGDVPKLTQYTFLRSPGNIMKTGVLVFFDKKPFEIVTIFSTDGLFYSICTEYANIGYDIFLHSMKIEKTDIHCVLKFSEIEEKTHDKIFCNQSFFVIIETIDMINNINM